ncbi:thioredoxin family protein [Actinoplanes sp. NPDC048967]|uniref:TlpA family protein disulfide reductase n=1 Tax=Actinoplanes sp. NPDC048967 TaxID=3155269 RepID=UPI00340682F8
MDTTGLMVVATVLVLGTVAGLWRRRTDGRFVAGSPASVGAAGGGSASAAPGPAAERSVEGGTVGNVIGSTGLSAERDAGSGGDASAAGQRLDPALLAQLGVQPAQATLLQFSSAFCAPCRAVRRVSGEVAALLPGVRHVEVDAESHLDAVRALGIWRTPTLLVLDAEGRVAKRATGVPGKAQLIAVLGDLLPAA